jgi:cystathionine gamma-synthase
LLRLSKVLLMRDIASRRAQSRSARKEYHLNKSVNKLPPQTWWHPQDLGKPIPLSTHAVSMALPLWDHVVGYETKRQDVQARLTTGYPRFVYHPLVLELGRELSSEGACLPFPSEPSAQACAAFIRKAGHDAQVVSRGEIPGVCTGSGVDPLKMFWQHTGLIVSSRQAEAWLSGKKESSAGPEARRTLRERLAGFYDCSPEDVLLCPTGMAAHYAALKVLLARSPGLPTVQLGFPYVDTLKLQERLGHGGILLHDLDSLPAQLEETLRSRSVAGCFCEIPGNPLLGSADLSLIGPVLRGKNLPLVVDDVVATPYNIDAMRHADLVATSLTKFIAGNGEVMGGALICNPRAPLYPELKRLVRAVNEELLWEGDAVVLETAARDFPERMRRHNATGLLLAERLRSHPAVERVWYPKWEFSDAYESVRRAQGGWGALITFQPRDAENRSAAIYDRMELCKGPSLGTTFTLVCPFTLLAHYMELDWAESCGVSRYLLRISAGLEDPEELWQKLDRSLRGG